MNTAKKTRVLTVIIVFVLVAAISSASLLSGAIWSESDAVHIRSADIENSTLIIGTHLIHLSALTQQLYDIAKESAEESGQSQIYYKSELADGTWFEISSANSLNDITNEGSPVSNSVVEALFMTHHTKSDGVTYDLRTNSAVSIFDLKSPYDVQSMEELLPLKNQWKIISDSAGDNETDQAVAARIMILLIMPRANSYTAERDKDLAAMQSYLDVLRNNDGGSSEIEQVQTVMASTDALRRINVFESVESDLSDYLDELSAAQSTERDEDEDPPPASNTSPSTLMSITAECIQNVQDSMIECQGKILTEDETVYQTLRMRYVNSFIAHAKSSDHASCDTDIANLIHLSNILNDVISSRDAEATLLTGTILPEATSRYTAALRAGENSDYRAEVANRSAQVLLNSVISANTSMVNTKRSELEFMITAYCSRIGAQAGIDFIDQRIELTKTFYSMPPSDAFSSSVTGTVDSHMDFLTKKRAELQKALGGSELDKLLSDKADLQSQLRSALDKNDLAGAKDLEDKISDLDDQISALQNQSDAELSDQLGKVSDLEKQLADAEASGNTSLASSLKDQLADAKADLSALQAGLSDGSLGSQVAALRADGLGLVDTDGSLSGTDMDQLGSDVDGLENLLPLSPKLAFNALKDLHSAMSTKDALDGTNAFGDLLDQIEAAILDSKDAYDSAMAGDKSAADLSAIADDFLDGEGDGSGDLLGAKGYSGGANDGSRGDGEGSGIAMPNLDRSDLLDKYGSDIYIMALQQYYDETGSEAAENLMVSLAQQQRSLGSLTVYSRISSPLGEYVPISAIGFYHNMRYVEKRNGSGTLAQGPDYYGFSIYSDSVTRGKDAKSVEYMPQAAAYLGGIHIIEDYSYDTFGIDCVYISGCSYAVIRTDELQALVDELFALFLA